jgi:hypothetical protein
MSDLNYLQTASAGSTGVHIIMLETKCHLKNHAVSWWLVGCAAFILLTASCSLFEPERLSSIPLLPTAEEQFRYAVQYRARSNPELMLDDNRFFSTRKIIQEHFQMVVEYFPKDQKYTPVARFQMTVMDAGLDYPKRINPGSASIKDSIEEFRKIAKDFPAIEIIQVDSMYKQGLCYYQLRDYDNAHRCFKFVCENYAGHHLPEIKTIATRACINHKKTFVYDENSSE